MLVDLTTAKLHLRVTGTDEDDLITIYIGAAEGMVTGFLNCNVYADAPTLAAAIVAAPATLAASTVTYDAAIVAADALGVVDERELATKYAKEAYAAAKEASNRTQAGIVTNSAVKAGILLTVGHLYEHRGDGGDDLPVAAKSILMPYRVRMGL